MASNAELEIIGQILKETARITTEGGSLFPAINTLCNYINSQVLTDPTIIEVINRTGQKTTLGFQLALNTANYQPSGDFFSKFGSPMKMSLNPDGKVTWIRSDNYIVNRPDPVKLQKQMTEVLKGLPKKLPMVVDPSKMTPEQLKLIRQIRYDCIKKRFITSTGMSAGLSLVFNVGDLLKGHFKDYAVHVFKDTGIAASSTLLGTALDGVPFLAEGAGVIVLGVIDLAQAMNTGDWKRFGLNVGLNTCATAGAYGGGKMGACVGSWFGPGPGTAIGMAIGMLIGGISGRVLAGRTRLGNLTTTETVQLIREKYNAHFKELGLEINPSLTLEQIIEQSKTGKFDVITTSDIGGIISADAVRSFIPDETINELLGFALRLNPTDRTKGLEKILQQLARS